MSWFPPLWKFHKFRQKTFRAADLVPLPIPYHGNQNSIIIQTKIIRSFYCPFFFMNMFSSKRSPTTCDNKIFLTLRKVTQARDFRYVIKLKRFRKRVKSRQVSYSCEALQNSSAQDHTSFHGILPSRSQLHDPQVLSQVFVVSSAKTQYRTDFGFHSQSSKLTLFSKLDYSSLLEI